MIGKLLKRKNSMDANNLRLVCTCGACPEQYDVYSAENELVGYIRFR